MRVITGSARGRRLKDLEGLETRPTTDRVKEGLFSALQFEIEGRRVLDLFAGTGQLGIECLSRGAAFALFIDQRREAVRLIQENLALTRLAEQSQVICGDALQILTELSSKTKKNQRFDLIFLDPPYRSGLLESATKRIVDAEILNPDGILVMEHPMELQPPLLSRPCRFRRTYRYGKTAITLCRGIEGNRDIINRDDKNNHININDRITDHQGG